MDSEIRAAITKPESNTSKVELKAGSTKQFSYHKGGSLQGLASRLCLGMKMV